jgi:hypothetical protein
MEVLKPGRDTMHSIGQGDAEYGLRVVSVEVADGRQPAFRCQEVDVPACSKSQSLVTRFRWRCLCLRLYTVSLANLSYIPTFTEVTESSCHSIRSQRAVTLKLTASPAAQVTVVKFKLFKLPVGITLTPAASRSR